MSPPSPRPFAEKAIYLFIVFLVDLQRMREACCICFEKASRSFNLECGHELCIKCCATWVSEHHNCPLCRANSAVMSIDTRSKSRRGDVCQSFWRYLTIAATRIPCLCHLNEPGLPCPAKLMGHAVDKIMGVDRAVWRRPDMRLPLKKIKRVCRMMRGRLATIPGFAHDRLCVKLDKIARFC